MSTDQLQPLAGNNDRRLYFVPARGPGAFQSQQPSVSDTILDFDCYYMLPVAADLQEIIVKKMPENAWE
jgi:hypothetical protein